MAVDKSVHGFDGEIASTKKRENRSREGAAGRAVFDPKKHSGLCVCVFSLRRLRGGRPLPPIDLIHVMRRRRAAAFDFRVHVGEQFENTDGGVLRSAGLAKLVDVPTGDGRLFDCRRTDARRSLRAHLAVQSPHRWNSIRQPSRTTKLTFI
ncbi:MAG: hypothetical protein WAU78_16005 [Roseiarcus sp.]